MVKYFEHLTMSASETKKLGSSLVKKIKKAKRRKALVFGLKGDLGGGKTTFLQGFAKGLRIKQRVLSPTFVILKRFQIKEQPYGESQVTARFNNFYHIDCYRVKKPKELLALDFKEIISDPKNIIAIEWAEKIKRIMPQNTIWINFEFIDKNIRKIQIKYD